MNCSRHFFLVLVVLAPVSISRAQTATTSVRGIVTDKTGAVLTGADAVLTEKSIGVTQAHKTNASGE